jgi:phage FluMu gp28-like protein
MSNIDIDLFLRYQAAFVMDDAPVKYCEKSRRIGITWAEAANSALISSRAGRGGSDTWYLAANEDGAKEFMMDCAFWAKEFNVICSEVDEVVLKNEDKDVKAYQIVFASGWRVTGLTSRPTNLRGKQGRVIADEFAFHPDPEGLEKAAMALLMWGGQVVFISTHNGINSYFNVLLEQVRAGKRTGSIHKITLDDALRDGLYRRICLVTGERWTADKEAEWRQQLIVSYGDNADEELFCVPKSSGQMYLSPLVVQARMYTGYQVLRISRDDEFSYRSEYERRDDIDIWLDSVVKPIILSFPKGYRTYFGMDFGRYSDASVISLLVTRPNLTRYVPLIIELRNMPIRQQEQILWFIIDRLDAFGSGVMDANGNGLAISESTKHRYGDSRIQYLHGSQDKYRDMFPRYKAALEDGKIDGLPSDQDVLADHGAVRLVDGVPKVPRGLRYRGTDGFWRHGDAAMSLVFAYWAATEFVMSGGVAPLQPGLISGASSQNEARAIFAAAQSIPLMTREAARKIF